MGLGTQAGAEVTEFLFVLSMSLPRWDEDGINAL